MLSFPCTFSLIKFLNSYIGIPGLDAFPRQIFFCKKIYEKCCGYFSKNLLNSNFFSEQLSFDAITALILSTIDMSCVGWVNSNDRPCQSAYLSPSRCPKKVVAWIQTCTLIMGLELSD